MSHDVDYQKLYTKPRYMAWERKINGVRRKFGQAKNCIKKTTGLI